MNPLLRLALPAIAIGLSLGFGARGAAGQGADDVIYIEDAVYDETIAEAVAAYEVGDFESAGTLAAAAIARDGNRPEGYSTLGAVAIARGDAAVAAESFVELAYLLRQWPPNEAEVAIYYAHAHDGLLEAGGLLLDEQRFEDAAATYQEMVEIFPESGDARFNHAIALSELGRWEALRDVGLAMHQQEPLNIDAHLFMLDALKGIIADSVSELSVFEASMHHLQVEELVYRMPIRLEALRLDRETGVLTGTVHGGVAPADERSTVRVRFLGRDGVLLETDIEFTSPGPNAAAPFTAQLQSGLPVTGWTYDYAIEP